MRQPTLTPWPLPPTSPPPPRPTTRTPDCAPSARCATWPTGSKVSRAATPAPAGGPGSRSPTPSASRGRPSTRSTPSPGRTADVFERFTSEARSVVTSAQDEARGRRAGSIDPARLLRARARADGRGGRALRATGVDHGTLAGAVARVGGPLDAE